MASDSVRLKSLFRHISKLCSTAEQLACDIAENNKRKYKPKTEKPPRVYKMPPCRDCGLRAWRVRFKDNTTVCLNCGHIVDGSVVGCKEAK